MNTELNYQEQSEKKCTSVHINKGLLVVKQKDILFKVQNSKI